MASTFRGKVTQIAGDLVQIWDAASGHSVFIDRRHIELMCDRKASAGDRKRFVPDAVVVPVDVKRVRI